MFQSLFKIHEIDTWCAIIKVFFEKQLKIAPSVFIKHLVCTLQINFEHKQCNQIFNANNN
jgi:hypothetical protein